MSFYKADKCAVCGKDFADGDDVVFCPICGTPHHRECYISHGKCVNTDRHRDGYEYVPENKEESGQNSQVNQIENTTAQSTENRGVHPPYPTVYRENIGGNESKNSKIDYEYFADSQEEIEGKKVSDIALFVKRNSRRFIDKFKKGKKISWNWSAFIFGPYYLFFRKMYTQGAIALATSTLASFLVELIYMGPIEEYMNYLYSITSLNSMSDDTAATLASLSEAVMPAVQLLVAISLVIRVFIAMFADSTYKTKVLGVLDNIDDEELITQFNSFTATHESVKESDIRAKFLKSVGGVSLTMPVLAYIVADLLVSILSKVLT